MVDPLEDAVARHYATSDLSARILRGLTEAGFDGGPVPPERLAPVDEFHIGGRAATEHAVAKMKLTGSEHVLDVGCGVGGTARYLASVHGCRVTGIDLTPAFIEAAQLLSERTGLAGRVRFETASALAMPYEPASFDAALTFHVAMNIEGRAGLYGEVARVLRPGAGFCVYDVMRGPGPGGAAGVAVRYPQPWADSATTSHLTTSAETEQLLTGAGFEVSEIDDRTDFGIEFFRQRLAVPEDQVPPLGLHLIVGPGMRGKFENLLSGLEDGSLKAVVMMAKRRS